jgi:Ca2+-binding EF-hand superfamily protein
MVGRTLRAALLVLIVAIPASTASGQDQSASGFDALDGNHDGTIDRDEWDQFGDRQFDRVDTDGDGLASPQELRRSFDGFDADHDGMIEGGESPLVIILGDSDGDGRVSPSEFEVIEWTSKPIDRDGDGAISRDEFRDARRQIYDRADYDRSLTLNRSEYNGAPSLSLFRF